MLCRLWCSFIFIFFEIVVCFLSPSLILFFQLINFPLWIYVISVESSWVFHIRRYFYCAFFFFCLGSFCSVLYLLFTDAKRRVQTTTYLNLSKEWQVSQKKKMKTEAKISWTKKQNRVLFTDENATTERANQPQKIERQHTLVWKRVRNQ